MVSEISKIKTNTKYFQQFFGSYQNYLRMLCASLSSINGYLVIKTCLWTLVSVESDENDESKFSALNNLKLILTSRVSSFKAHIIHNVAYTDYKQ